VRHARRHARAGRQAPIGIADGVRARGAPRDGRTAIAPWVVAGIAVVALFALVAVSRFSSTPSAPASPVGNAPFAGGGGSASGVDLSSIPPEVQAQRLSARVMRLVDEKKMDSAQFFANMALQVYGSLPSLDDGARFELGSMANAFGDYGMAKAQADTVLASSPTDLLGLALAMRTARSTKDAGAAAGYAKRLVAAAPAERKTQNPAYQRHSADIDKALKEAAR
jgi:hypothetical protein